MTTSGDVESVITVANGQPVHGVTDLARIFAQIGVGKTVTLTVTRGDQSRQVDITLADVSRNQGWCMTVESGNRLFEHDHAKLNLG